MKTRSQSLQTQEKYALLSFSRKIYQVYPVAKLINRKRNTCTVDRNGRLVVASVEMLHVSRKYLEDLAKSMTSRQLHVRLYPLTKHEKRIIIARVHDEGNKVLPRFNTEPMDIESEKEFEDDGNGRNNICHGAHGCDKSVRYATLERLDESENNNHVERVGKNEVSLSRFVTQTYLKDMRHTERCNTDGSLLTHGEILSCHETDNKELGASGTLIEEITQRDTFGTLNPDPNDFKINGTTSQDPSNSSNDAAAEDSRKSLESSHGVKDSCVTGTRDDDVLFARLQGSTR